MKTKYSQHFTDLNHLFNKSVYLTKPDNAWNEICLNIYSSCTLQLCKWENQGIKISGSEVTQQIAEHSFSDWAAESESLFRTQISGKVWVGNDFRSRWFSVGFVCFLPSEQALISTCHKWYELRLYSNAKQVFHLKDSKAAITKEHISFHK